ncbi:hypothetical protein ACIBG8_02840 [Nonomuraea sp. NPDC050556]|uniref:hypothetical protein n=1 Tax=Nonomuraea sp. NPDC050556 TaxID=3364369 RepID=UPI0037AB64B8
MTIIPEKSGSLEVADAPDPVPGPDDLLVQGVCGTYREIMGGDYGWAPDGNGFAPGGLVVKLDPALGRTGVLMEPTPRGGPGLGADRPRQHLISARSTPTGATTSRRRGRSPVPTRPGRPGW